MAHGLRHLTHVYPRFKTLSGGETAMLQLARELNRLGIRSTIFTRGYSHRCDALRDPDVEIVTPTSIWKRNTGNHLVDSFLDVWLAPFVLTSAPRNTDGFIFHSESSALALWWAKHALRVRKPCVFFCYQPPRFAYDLMESTGGAHPQLGRLLPLYAAVHRWFDRRWAKSADAIWTFSKAYGAWCRSLYDRPDVVCIPPGIDFERFHNGDPEFVRRKWAIGTNVIVLVTVNKMIPRKNLDVFLKVLSWLREQGQAVKGFLVGDGPSRPGLERMAGRAGLNDVAVFTGHVPMDELPHYYAGGTVYLFLERNVPFGMTPLEAAAAGTPVIAPRGGGAFETILDGATGYLVDDRLCVEEIGRHILRIAADPDRGQAMRRRAREHARNFTWSHYAREVVEHFCQTRADCGNVTTVKEAT